MIEARNLLKIVWKPLKRCIRHYPYPIQFSHFLRNLPLMQCTQLPNGLTVATEERECYNACVGLYINTGSRYENNLENGITHFFEHIAFKGTNSRAKTVLEEEMSCTGARFKCFTIRDTAAYYSQCLCQDVPLIVDILSDCLFNNSYSHTDIETQKKTVFVEMLEHDKDTNGLLYDYLHGTAFQGTPLAQTVMGPSSNLYNFNACTISKFISKSFDLKKIVLICVGGVKHEQMLCLANTYFNICKSETTLETESSVYRFTGSEVRFRNDSLPFANVAVAVEGPGFCDENNVVMEVASSIVGGWDRSQAGGLDHAINIARAASTDLACDYYKSFNINYMDTSLWGVQFMAPTLKVEDMLYIVQDEWMRMCVTVSDAEVQRAKRELKTKLLSNTESNTGAFHEIGRWLLYNGYRPPLYERLNAIDKVYAKDIKRVCNKYIYDKCPAVAAIGSTEALPEYTTIRAGMYWLRI